MDTWLARVGDLIIVRYSGAAYSSTQMSKHHETADLEALWTTSFPLSPLPLYLRHITSDRPR